MNSDIQWMEKALSLARKGEGLTRPNPPVGAVVVRGGKSDGEGYHRRAGADHAEVVAIRNAGARALGATLYVTLEPCCTHGRTPPCTDLIIRAGIRRVVAAVRDPNPQHQGRGFACLRKHGIEVVEGVCAGEGLRLIEPFANWIVSGRPFVTLKLGVSLDGRIADRSGASRWITGPASLRLVQDMRRRADAIIVGAGTVLADDPSLLPRPARGRKPLRVILDASGRVSPSAAALTDEARSRTILATTSACPEKRRAEWAATGARVWLLAGGRRGVSLSALLAGIGKEGVLHALCEGGGEAAYSFIRGGYVDEYVFFVAPRIIGGAGAKCAVGGEGWPLKSAPRLSITECRRIGDDVIIRAVPRADPSRAPARAPRCNARSRRGGRC